MANNDTEIGISIQTDAKNASDSLSELSSNLEAIELVMKRFRPFIDAYNKLTLSVKRLSEVNMQRFNQNMKKTTECLNGLNESIDQVKSKVFVNQVSSMTTVIDNYRESVKKAANMARFDLSNFKNLDFSSFENIKTEAITKLSDSLTKLRNSNIAQTSNSVNSLVASMKNLETLNFNPRMRGNINAQLDSMATTLKSFMDKLEGFNVDGISKLFSSLSKVPKAMQAMEKVDVSKIGSLFSTLTTQIQPFLAKLRESSVEINGFSNILNKLNKVRPLGGLSRAKQEIKEVGNESEKSGHKLNKMLSFGKIYAFYNQFRHFGSGIANVLQKSIDFTEIENYFSRAMGNMRSEAMKFQNQLSDMYAMSMPDTMKAQATFKNMLGSLGGLTNEMSYMLSERITKMALDFSSLYNVSIESAMTKFQASLSKQVRPIRSVSGYDITQNVLGATMKEIDINDRKISQMNEIEKRLLVILTLQQQMARSSAMGDFSRTIEFSGFIPQGISNNLVNAS